MLIPLGRFLLHDVVGKGGTGVVWRAQHLRLDLPVAVKVLPPQGNKLALRAHKNEVQAVARLHHPHVVAVLDAGSSDAPAALAAQRAGLTLAEGSPYLVIELASGGDLGAQRPPFAWGLVVDLLRTLLSALAHAHARGVIHKDLKPQNVLLCTDDDVRPGVKLTDFGLAMSDKGERFDGGTPLFMAPEQFESASGDIGPWTDLYALGCLAWWLTTGAAPFPESTWTVLAMQHGFEPAPPLPPGIDAPAGFAAWVARLLHKSPADRFRCAADADAALARVDPQRPSPPTDRLPDGMFTAPLGARAAALAGADDVTQRRPVSVQVQPAQVSPAHAQGAQPQHLEPPTQRPRSMPGAPPGSDDAGSQEPPAHPTQPIQTWSSTQAPHLDVGAAAPPTSWRATQAPQPDLRIVDAGLSLWGLRPVPMVGREAERDVLWTALRDVHAARAPRVVALRGPSGVGKSRLAEWVSHRARETGAALVLKATFQAIGGRGDGLAAAVARHCGLADTAPDAAVARATAWLQRWLPKDDLTGEELAALAGKRDGMFASSDEREAALLRLLAALARERPLLVWLDDVHHGKDALALVARVLAFAPELACLFVLTAVDELLDGDARARMDALLTQPRTRPLDLAPLDDSAADELCARLLGGAAAGLADEVRRRTEGNPLFAVHLVGDWVARGLLEVQPGGLALKPGTAPELPDALHALWDQRIASAVADDAARSSLEVAAVLGSSVDFLEWEAAVKAARMPVAGFDDLVDALAAKGLARRTEGGFAFAHAMVRGSIERRAREGGRLAAHHRSAARGLATLWGTQTAAAANRIGRHLLAAGVPQQALKPLLAAGRAALEEGCALEAGAVLADWERAREQLALPDSDERVAPGLILCAQVAGQDGRHDEARDLAARVVRVAADPKQRAAALRVQANAAVALGDTDAAARLYEEAHQDSLKVDDQAGVGAALYGLGDVDYYRGDRAGAALRYHAVSVIWKAHGKKSDLAASLWSLGYVEMERGELDAAKRLFHEQRSLCRASRDRLGEANAENALGELARKKGDLADAERRYLTAARIAGKNGLSRRWTFRLNLAHLHVLRGDVAAALDGANEILAGSAAREPIVAAASWWIVAYGAASRGDLVAFDRAADAACEHARGSDVVEADVAVMADRAGAAVVKADPARAERAFAFAREKWKALGIAPPSGT